MTRLRDRLMMVWPFLAALVVGSILVVMLIVVIGLGQQRQDSADARARLFTIAKTLVECTTPSPKPAPPSDVIDTRDSEDIHECAEWNDSRLRDSIRLIVDADQDGTLDALAAKEVYLRTEASLCRIEAALRNDDGAGCPP